MNHSWRIVAGNKLGNSASCSASQEPNGHCYQHTQPRKGSTTAYNRSIVSASLVNFITVRSWICQYWKQHHRPYLANKRNTLGSDVTLHPVDSGQDCVGWRSHNKIRSVWRSSSERGMCGSAVPQPKLHCNTASIPEAIHSSIQLYNNKWIIMMFFDSIWCYM